MWLAVDAAAPGLRVWPVGGDGAAGPVIAVADLAALERGSRPAAIDGLATAAVLRCPVAIDVIAPEGAALPLLRDESGSTVGTARLIGALELAKWRDAPARGRLVCQCGADDRVAWTYARGGRIERLVLTPTGARLAEILHRTTAEGASDEDDDVAFERGLSIAGDAHDLSSDLERVAGDAASGRLTRGAVGAAFAGVLIAHDATQGLRLGRLGAPAVLVGEGLLADRYALALGRFGVAVRRIDPLRALVQGCLAVGLGRIPIA